MFGILFALFALAAASAVGVKPPATFVKKGNHVECPGSQDSMFTGPRGGHWGIMCGTDTRSTTYFSGPFSGLNFEECIVKCGKTEVCQIATYTGACYLKLGNKNQGYIKAPGVRTAIKLN